MHFYTTQKRFLNCSLFSERKDTFEITLTDETLKVFTKKFDKQKHLFKKKVLLKLCPNEIRFHHNQSDDAFFTLKYSDYRSFKTWGEDRCSFFPGKRFDIEEISFSSKCVS